MRKIVKVNGIARGEVTVVPQINLAFNVDVTNVEGRIVLPNKELHQLKSYSVSARVGESSILTVHHITEKSIEAVAEWAIERTVEFIQDFDAGNSVEARLNTNGFTL